MTASASAALTAPAVDQLCLNTKGERWTCGAAARDELIKFAGNKTWTCNGARSTDRRGRIVARCEVDGEDIQKWLVRNGWALAYVRFSRDYEAGRKSRARGQGRDVAGRLHRAVGLARPQQEDRHSRRGETARKRQRDPAGVGVGIGRALARLHHQGQRQPLRRMHLPSPASRWYAKIEMKISKGTRWFCSVEEAEAAGCRETRRLTR